jgi:glycosyltransferase involved in cell wall biosynthesis
VHFGDGPLRNQAMKSVTSPLVKFELRGQTSNAEIRKFYREEAVNCFVNLSIVEGLPVSVMEAISHGIPVLATAVYGVPEIVIDGFNGLTLSAQFSEQQLDNALLRFMSNDAPMDDWRKNARALFLERFNAAENYRLFASQLAATKL